MKRINIVGVFPGRTPEDEAIDCINGSDIIFSGMRNMELVESPGKPVVKIGEFKKFQEDMASAYNAGKVITVIASGDPLFYGIGKYITENYKSCEIRIVPEVSSVQVALSRIPLNSGGLCTVSLHGRPIKGLAQKIRNNNKICIFTDSINTPAAIAAYMIRFGLSFYRAYVFENLGYKNEKISSLPVNELMNKEFEPLNIMILTSENSNKISMPDDDMFARHNGNITKKEIRNISISDLELNDGETLWDVGSGSGSVAIAASFQNQNGNIYAIEKNSELCQNIQSNMEMCATDVNIINGIAPEVLHDLPDPDCVFIGGSSGRIKDIMDYSFRRMRINGRMVINITTVDNLQKALDYIKSGNLKAEIRQVNISKLMSVSKYKRFVPMDQIYIIKVVKNE
jgi:precorrin-6Y C5,15-methyltransferase (decarboxylating)